MLDESYITEMEDQLGQDAYSDNEELPDESNIINNQNADIDLHDIQEPPDGKLEQINDVEASTPSNVTEPFNLELEQEIVNQMEKEVSDISASLDRPIVTSTDILDDGSEINASGCKYLFLESK